MFYTYLGKIEPLILQAGTIIRRHIHLEHIQVEEKINSSDLVTMVDKEVEHFLIKKLSHEFPSFQFLTEETFPSTQITANLEQYTWVIDPLDGTMNFVHGLERCAVSIGLMKGRDVLLGAILDVKTNELYTAIRGHGAYRNGQKITCSTINTLEESLIATGFSATQWKEGKQGLVKMLKPLLGSCRGIRITGSSCLDLAALAAGQLDGFCHYELAPWDKAVGSLLIREAGGTCSNLFGEEDVLFSPWIIASNGRIQHSFLQLLSSSCQSSW